MSRRETPPPAPRFHAGLLLSPAYLLRRARTLRSWSDLAGRAANLRVYARWRFDEMRLAARGRWLPERGLRAEALATLSRLLATPADLLAAARLRRALAAARARPRGSAAGAPVNPSSPEDIHPPCPVHLSWNIHIACNYDCAYCWFQGRWGEFAPKNKILAPEEWARHWDRFNDAHGSARVDVAGGEPFTYPRFLEVLQAVSRRNVVLVQTNLSWNPERFVERVDPRRVEITASYHHEYIGDPAPYIAKVERLRAAGFATNVSFVAYPPFLERLPALVDAFYARGIPLNVQPFRGVWRGRPYPRDYTPEARRFVERLVTGAYRREEHPKLTFSGAPRRGGADVPLILDYQLGGRSTKGRLCNAGVLYARLQADGEVTRCAQGGGRIGSFFDADFRLRAEPAPCPFTACGCINEVVYVAGAAKGPRPDMSVLLGA